MGNLYREDVYLWSREQSAAIRKAAEAGSNLPIDWENVAEEIESVGNSQRSALRSQIRRVLEHFIKLQASPAREPRRGWIDSVIDAQAEIDATLGDSPSLRREVAVIVDQDLPKVRKRAGQRMARYDEIPTVGLDTLAYTADQVLGWCPDL